MSVSMETLMDQASDTAHCYMHRAITSIDKKFGEGYAKKNPTLVGAFMQASSQDFQAMVLHSVLERIDRSLDSIAANIHISTP